MDNNSRAGPIIFLGILGIFGIAMLLTRGGNKNRQLAYQYNYTKPAMDWEIVRPSHSATPATLQYENEERWELIRGPDRLIEEIVIHRKVTQNA